METAPETEQENPEARGQGNNAQPAPASPRNGRPVRVEPDLDFIHALRRQGGATLKKCFQCGTCSATCTLSPDSEPFPRKEMAWSVWGMRDRLLTDPDIWLCHQCHDCSTSCPRGARPGDVLAAVRQECVGEYSSPRFLGKWMNQPRCIPLLLGTPITLLVLALSARVPVAKALGLSEDAGARILYSYSRLFPHWLLNGFFALFGLLAVAVVVAGIVRFWRAMKAAVPPDRLALRTRGVIPSILSTLKKVCTHDDFALCTKSYSRLYSHLCVFFGFLALTLVSAWVVTARYNPLIRDDFIYPFGFWNPWKILANLGGVALLTGLLLMIRDRLRDREQPGGGAYSDWALIAKLVLVTATGFVTEVLHYLRLEPHRHIAYFVHLVFVFVVLIYLPYSKLAHIVYRGTAMVFAEHLGRNRAVTTVPNDAGRDRAT